MLGNAQFNSTPFCPELFPASFVPSIPQRWTIAKGLQEWFNWGNGVVTLKLFGCFVRSFGRPSSFLFHFFSLYCNPISVCAAIIISWLIPYFIFDLSTGTLFSSRCFLQHVCRSWQIMAYFPLSLATAEQTSSTIVIVISIVVNIIINTRPKPAYGRQGLAGSWCQDTDEVSPFLVFLMSHFTPAALSSD